MPESTTKTAATDPSDWTMLWDNGVTYPFVEDENANITGLGHQDCAEFARLVNHYDEACNGEPFDPEDQWSADYIGHRWAVLSDDHERLFTKVGGESVGPETPGAIAITTLWGQR